MSNKSLIRRLYARVGLTVRVSMCDDVPLNTYTYDPKRRLVRLCSDEAVGMQLHELAHFIVARPKDRLLPNYGLGESLEEYDYPYRDNLRTYPLASKYELSRAEARASVLNVLLARQYFGEDESGLVSRNLSVFDKGVVEITPKLQQWGIIDGKKRWNGQIRR